VTELVQGAWARFIRRSEANAFGDVTDLRDFLFGNKRADLAQIAAILSEVQQGRCFYCQGNLRAASTHVDHFIPWSRYPVDLGHNFVAACRDCNTAKSDTLAAVDHLNRWVAMVDEHGRFLPTGFVSWAFNVIWRPRSGSQNGHIDRHLRPMD